MHGKSHLLINHIHAKGRPGFDYDVVIKEKVINTFNVKTEIPIDLIKSLSLIYDKELYDAFFAENPYHIQAYRKAGFTSWGGRGKNNLRFCPICLGTDEIPYFRRPMAI